MYENRLAYGPRPGCMLSTITTGLPPLTQKPECSGSGGIWQINDTCLAIDRFRSAEYRLNTEENIQDCTGRLISRRFYQFFHLFPIYPQLPKVLVLCPNGGICPKGLPNTWTPLTPSQGCFFVTGMTSRIAKYRLTVIRQRMTYDCIMWCFSWTKCVRRLLAQAIETGMWMGYDSLEAPCIRRWHADRHAVRATCR